MSEAFDLGEDLALLAARLDALAKLVQQIAGEAAGMPPRGVDDVIERRRSEIYAAMNALGLAVHEFVQSEPPAERLEAGRDLVIHMLRAISLTSPIAFFGAQGKRRRLSYFELIRHVRKGRAAGADVAARLLDDYYVHTKLGEAFLNRLNMIAARLAREVTRCLETSHDPVHLISLQYIGGDDLFPLAPAAAAAPGMHVICLDESVEAARDAERTLKPAFGARVECRRADAGTWLCGPSYPSGSACVVYAPSLIEQLSDRKVVRVLEGSFRVLRPGGVLLMGATPGAVPVGEQMIRDWLLGWDWHYRSEDEWRALVARSRFGSAVLKFQYEPLGINALVRVEKDG